MATPPIIAKVAQLAVLVLATLVYCVLVVRPRRPGLPRFLASLPAFAVFSLSPTIVSESLVLSGCMGLTLMWVASFKLLAYSGGRGALAHPAVAGGSAWQWAALLVLPFFPAKSGREPASSSGSLALLSVLSRLGVWLILNAALLSPDSIPAAVRHVLYAVYMWMFVSLCLDAATPLSGQLLQGVPLQPAMDAPYAATSVREFWGRRYNQIVSATLLETVYKPIVQGRWVVSEGQPKAAVSKEANVGGSTAPAPAGPDASNVAVRAGPPPPSPPLAGEKANAGDVPQSPSLAAAAAAAAHKDEPGRREQRPRTPLMVALLALGASFLVSGIMHEICIAIMCGGRFEGSFRMTAFFLVQPLLILLQETAMSTLLPRKAGGKAGSADGAGGARTGQGASVLQAAVTLALVLLSAELFWASLESCRIDERGLKEVVGAMQWAAERVRAAGSLPGV